MNFTGLEEEKILESGIGKNRDCRQERCTTGAPDGSTIWSVVPWYQFYNYLRSFCAYTATVILAVILLKEILKISTFYR
jgi:hypothetical protein